MSIIYFRKSGKPIAANVTYRNARGTLCGQVFDLRDVLETAKRNYRPVAFKYINQKLSEKEKHPVSIDSDGNTIRFLYGDAGDAYEPRE